ncbi:Cas9 inhibitor AcrIIA9 family protein [Flavobacterium sp. UW10123]|uniref:PcfK-like family protein n=1 Tax=Flavobacterium sp. UW10123 TaxID=3230800 RepID=UPI00339AE8BF
MKASEKFRTAIDTYLKTLAQGDTAFAPHFAKASKNLESCLHYIMGEVKKTGLCAFDDQEIYDMAVKYFTDDTIGTPAPIACKVAVQSSAPDLFSQTQTASITEIKKETPPVKKEVQPVQTALTLFDL